MPRKAPGGVRRPACQCSLPNLHDTLHKEQAATSHDSKCHINHCDILGKLHIDRRPSNSIEILCMSAAGLLPQHIRNLIMSKDIEAIAAVLHSYQDALNGASTEDAVNLYTQDGVCMSPHASVFVGIDNVRKAYEGFFATIKFDVRFDIKEIVPVGPDWAFARTNSAGTIDVKGRGLGNQANQELFIFQKRGGEWKIARFCFSTTKPLP